MLGSPADEDYEDRLIMKMLNEIGSSAVIKAPLVRTDRVGSVPASIAETLVSNAAGTVDSAKLSSTSLLVQQNVGEDVRYEKVAAIRDAIQSGTYIISASAVADKLLQSMAG